MVPTAPDSLGAVVRPARAQIPDEAIILRGGSLRDRAAATDSAEAAEANPRIQIFGLSVECLYVGTIDEALRATRRPHRLVRVTTAARVRAAGMDVVPTLDEPHATLRLSKPLDDSVWRELQRVFDEPIENGYRGSRS